MKIDLLKNRLLVLTLTFVFGEAALSKIIGGSVPDWFLKQFAGSLLDIGGPSLALSFWMIAVLETVTAVLLLTALVRDEVSRASGVTLKLGLLSAQLTFFALMIGERLTHQYDQAFQLFAYSALTFLASRLITSSVTGETRAA